MSNDKKNYKEIGRTEGVIVQKIVCHYLWKLGFSLLKNEDFSLEVYLSSLFYIQNLVF